jgi:3-hydroxybutyryl-CoA dehydrogenase
MSEADANRAMENLTSSADFSSLKDSPLIIESITEDLKIKREYFQKLEAACGKHAAFASNTSSLLIGDLAANLKDPSRMIGIHFFNPATKMALVEIVKTEESSDAALKAALDFAKAIGKTPVIVKDSPCFVVNRIMAVYLNEAAILYQEKIASREDIDNSIRLGLNHPMGPLALMDFIGLDIFAEIMKNLYEKTSDKKYLPAKIISDLVARGKLGRKSGEGFYKY